MIRLLDIGARGGIHPRWKRLADQLNVVAMDVDSRAEVPCFPVHSFSRIDAVLGRESAPAMLYITRNGGCSSLYEPNHEYLKRFTNPQRFDVTERRAAETVPLAHFRLQPHFIKLDTQGSDLPILQGAGDVLDSVIGIEIEVLFAELYKGQPFAGDIDTWLRSKEFELHDINRFYWRDLVDGDIRLIFGEALYFRRDSSAIAKALHDCYRVSLRQTAAHAFQWASRYLRPKRIYDSDMQIGL